MKNVTRFRATLLATPFALACLIPGKTSAFSEDLCSGDDREGGHVIENCLTAEACDPDEGGDTTRCRANLMFDATIAGEEAEAGGARSMIHVDAVHFLAQVVGLRPKAAYWIAAYDQVADVTEYHPFGMNGEVVWAKDDGTPTTTAYLNGWWRASESSGGFSYHFVAPFSDNGERLIEDCSDNPVEGSICGMRPNLHDAVHEGQLVHMRQWAMEGRKPCVDGLTMVDRLDSYYLYDECYMNSPTLSTEPEVVERYIQGFRPTLAGSVKPVTFTAYSGDQIATYRSTEDGYPQDIVYGDDEGLAQVLISSYSEDELALLLGQDGIMDFVQLIRMGIYLHSLADRISHYECGDASVVAGPDGQDRFTFAYDNYECGQDLHAYRHYQEVGHAVLPDRTAEALEYTLNELDLFGALHPQWQSDALEDEDPDERLFGFQNAIDDLLDVLRISDGCERLRAMIELIDDYGFEQLPGNDVSGIDTMCAQ